MVKIALLLRGEMPQRSAFMAEKVQQFVVCNQADAKHRLSSFVR
jgi:hypothetical protein